MTMRRVRLEEAALTERDAAETLRAADARQRRGALARASAAIDALGLRAPSLAIELVSAPPARLGLMLP